MSEIDHVTGDYGAKVFGIHPGDENEPGTESKWSLVNRSRISA